MENEFIPYELALILKALGFDEPCFGNYNNLTDETRFIFGKTNEGSITANKVPGTNTILLSNERILAPTFSQAFKWFRDNNHCRPAYVPLTVAKFVSMDDMSYEEAELACLDKLIEIVKSKNNKI
jgi:hypothetical protein